MDNTEPAIKATLLHRIPACSSDACKQGRADCPAKQACLLPEPADKPIVDIVPKWLVLMAIGALLAIIFWALPQLFS